MKILVKKSRFFFYFFKVVLELFRKFWAMFLASKGLLLGVFIPLKDDK